MALLLFLAALASRLPGLALFLTSDENTNIFFAGSNVIVAFLRGDLRGTYWHFYPGVTMSWLDAVGMAGQYLWQWLSGANLPPFTEYVYGDILSLVVAARLPYAILTAAAIPAIYLLARKLLPNHVALLGALFLAFDPFYLAHSRVVHGDAPLAVFMSLSALTFFIYLQRSRKSQNQTPTLSSGVSKIFGNVGQVANLSYRTPNFWDSPLSFGYLAISAIWGGLAALTKTPGPFMAIFVVGMSLVYAGLEWYQVTHKRPMPNTSESDPLPPNLFQIIRRWLTVCAIWGGLSLVTFVLLWPAMWVDPLGTIQRMLAETFGKVEEGHLVFFFGQPTLDPGPWFYPYVIPFRLSPVVLIGLFPAFLLTTYDLDVRQGIMKGFPSHASRLIWVFTLSLFLFGILSPKKQDRYLLPLFPFLDLLAAIGWVRLFNLLGHLIKNRLPSSFPQNYSLKFQSVIYYFPVSLLILGQLLPVFTYYPYYLTYFNPLMGGPERAAQTTLMGWGEGMEQVAAYLNTKPNAPHLYVASTPSQTLLPYFTGTGKNFYTNDIALRADYVVLYLAQRQRQAPSPDIVRYFEAQSPEKVITLHKVAYAQIYPGPKLILSDIPPEATAVNLGLGNIMRLAGYQLSPLKLTLYWHALAPTPVNYTVSLRVKAADGRLLAQQDSWPADGLLPTSQWQPGDYVTDTRSLSHSEADQPQADYFEIVVYNAETGETLGPPLTLPMSHE